jgi:hypothetical protein
MVLIECWYYRILEKNGESRTFCVFAFCYKIPQNRNQTIKTAKKIKQSIPLCYPTIPSHSKNKSKQSKSRDNPGKYSTLPTHLPPTHPDVREQIVGARHPRLFVRHWAAERTSTSFIHHGSSPAFETDLCGGGGGGEIEI